MSAGSTHGTGSACISWETGAKSSWVGFSRSGRNMRNVASFIAIGVFKIGRAHV